ncbi:hypothetical protein D3C84_771430 [compost metagenome]
MPFGLALPGFELDLLQVDFRQVAGERAAQAERPGRAIQCSLEVAEVFAVGVGDFAVEAAQRHFRFVDQRIEPVPGEIQPVDFRRGVQAFTPVQNTREFETLLVVGGQVQRSDLCAVGVDFTLQHQCNRALLSGQRGVAAQLVAVFQVAVAGQFKLIELQGVWQVRTGFEAVGGDPHLGRQVVHQRLQLAAQLAVQVTAAVGGELQGFQQVAVDFQRQRPGLGRRQGQFALSLERPVAVGLQEAGQIQA